MKTVTRLIALGALISIGCGDNPPRADDEAGDAPDTGITQDADADADADADEDVDADGESGSGTADDSTGDGDPTDDDATDDSPTTDTNDDDDGPQTKFDLGGVPDAAHNCMTDEDAEFSYLWAANSGQGTISKINTVTVTEVGRYIVRPDSAGSPSRTSVSLSGNVAVANRSGGVTKIYANPEHCEESNGMPGIQTSNNNQFLPWGTEECVAWYTPFGYASQRPVAWGPGEFNQGTCNYENEEVWTSGNNQNGAIDILVLDGDDGTVAEMISVPTGGNSLISDFYGIYGGAVDGDGNFWGTQLGSSSKLIKVVRSDMSYEVFDPPDGPHWYGMTVDNEGMVWMCSSSSAGRFDPMTETFAQGAANGYTGCMADADENGLLWMSAGGQGIIGVNRDTLVVEKSCNQGGPSYGISIDFEGYVWGVTGSTATKWDPETCQSWQYAGLTGAYTYSDMTGYALSNAGTPSG
jgi:hypothetical protein